MYRTRRRSSLEWLPLDTDHWPKEGALVVLSYPTGLGGSAYLTARCCGSANDQYPFSSTDAGDLGAGDRRVQVRQLAADQRETERKEMKRSGYLQQRRKNADAAGRDAADDEAVHAGHAADHDARGLRLGPRPPQPPREKWGETYDVYFPAMQAPTSRTSTRERLDRATLSYIRDNQFYSFTERYPEIKQVGYGPRRTK